MLLRVLYLLCISSAAIAAEPRVYARDHLVAGGAGLTVVDGVGDFALDGWYEYVIGSGQVGIGGQLSVVSVDAATFIGIGPRITGWFRGGNATTPYAGGGMSLNSVAGVQALGLGGHGGVSVWLSESSALLIGGDLTLLFLDGAVEPVFVVPIGILGVGRKR